VYLDAPVVANLSKLTGECFPRRPEILPETESVIEESKDMTKHPKYWFIQYLGYGLRQKCVSGEVETEKPRKIQG
jgi:hypothetical protein